MLHQNIIEIGITNFEKLGLKDSNTVVLLLFLLRDSNFLFGDSIINVNGVLKKWNFELFLWQYLPNVYE